MRNLNEQERLIIHPDLKLLNKVLPTKRGENGSSASVSIIFIDPAQSYPYHYCRISDEFYRGKKVVFLLSHSEDGMRKMEGIDRDMIREGVAGTKFSSKHLIRAGQRQFTGGYSFRLVRASKKP